jgi:hypothetical protein
VPQTHADLAKLIQRRKFKDKVTTYDIEKSGVGFMFMTQDAQDYPQFPALEQGPRRGARCACSRRPAPCWSASRRART